MNIQNIGRRVDKQTRIDYYSDRNNLRGSSVTGAGCTSYIAKVTERGCITISVDE